MFMPIQGMVYPRELLQSKIQTIDLSISQYGKVTSILQLQQIPKANLLGLRFCLPFEMATCFPQSEITPFELYLTFYQQKFLIRLNQQKVIRNSAIHNFEFYITYIQMPPKSVPKLTKKQLDEQKKEQARLQKQKQEQQAAAEKAKLQQQQRLRQIERKKRSEEERLRIVSQKQKIYPILQQRIRSQKDSYKKLMQQQKWNKFTTPYLKNYSVEGTSLSTFMKLFANYKHKIPKQTLAECEECERYITKLQQKILQYRTQYNEQAEKETQRFIQILQKQSLNKLQQIMIQYANSGEQMQQRNVEEAKKKNQQNSAQKATKPIDSVYEMSDNFKIGMYINTLSTKAYNKFNPIGIKQFGFNSQVPPKWTNNTAVVKFQWVNFNQYAPHMKEEFRIVGGVFNIQFYDMFIGTKKTNNISIKKFFKGRQILDKLKLQPVAIKDPFKIMYEIPSYVFMVPYSKTTIKIAQYDSTAGKWSILPNQFITDYMEQEKRIVCKVSRPDPVAFVEYKCADYPYIAWELRTVEKGKILLDFQLARTIPNAQGEHQQFMIQFQIGPNVMKLNLDKVWPQFKHLTQNYYTPEEMLWQLSKRGVHLLPTDDDYAYSGGLKMKDRQSQKNAIRDIAYAVESFTIRSEPNDSGDIRVKIRENLDFENIFLEDQEKDWKRIRWGDRDKCWVDGKGVMQRHCNLQILLQQHDFCLKQCVDRMKFNNEYLLRKTVMKVLQLTRVLAFTTSNPKIKSKLVQVLKQKIIVA